MINDDRITGEETPAHHSQETETNPVNTNMVGQPEINRERIISRLLDLCRIPGPSRNETGVFGYIADFAMDPGRESLEFIPFPDETIPAGGNTSNILLRVPGTGSGDIVLLSAHMDTVPLTSGESLSVVMKDGVLSAAGNSILGGDDRSGIAAALEMIELGLRFPECHPGFEVLFTVQEELGCLGSRNLDSSLFAGKYGYNLDGETPPGSAIISAPEKGRYLIRIYGKSSHAALAPEKGVSAVKAAGAILGRLPQGRIDAETTANIGSISGGGQTNLVAEYAEISGEVRSSSLSDFKKVCNEVDRVCASVSSGEIRVEVSWEHVYPAFSVDPEGVCANKFIRACRRSGCEPVLLSSPGGGDSNNLNAIGIEDIVFGLGMHEIHTADEYLIIDEYLRAVEILKELVFVSSA